MEWILLALVVGVVAFVLLKRGSLIDPAEARKYLQEGAVVVDVRTPAEFEGQHLRGAMNVPLQDLPQAMEKKVPDRGKTLLLHCHSGTRSGMARSILKRAGYENVFNLGGYGRAQQIVEQK